MVAITASNSATPSLQSVLSRTRVLQARAEADQAEAKAQDLRQQSDAAEVDAQQSQDKVRRLEANARSDTSSTYENSAAGRRPATGRIINLRA